MIHLLYQFSLSIDGFEFIIIFKVEEITITFVLNAIIITSESIMTKHK